MYFSIYLGPILYALIILDLFITCPLLNVPANPYQSILCKFSLVRSVRWQKKCANCSPRGCKLWGQNGCLPVRKATKLEEKQVVSHDGPGHPAKDTLKNHDAKGGYSQKPQHRPQLTDHRPEGRWFAQHVHNVLLSQRAIFRIPTNPLVVLPPLYGMLLLAVFEQSDWRRGGPPQAFHFKPSALLPFWGTTWRVQELLPPAPKIPKASMKLE